VPGRVSVLANVMKEAVSHARLHHGLVTPLPTHGTTAPIAARHIAKHTMQ